MVKKVYLVRHGDKIREPGDPGLSPLGKKQAMLVGKYLSQFPIDNIICSPLSRARLTAEIINRYVDCCVIKTSDLLKERMNWGNNPGQSIQDFLKEWRKASINRSWKPSSGDSAMIASKRFKKVILSKLKNTKRGLILVSHGGIISDYLMDNFSSELLDNKIEGFSKRVLEGVSECSITELSFENDRNFPKLIKLGNVKHLEI